MIEVTSLPFVPQLVPCVRLTVKRRPFFQVFEGHTHYVMQIVINPKDNNTFASASLDRTVKVCFTFKRLLTSQVLFVKQQFELK